MDLSNLINKFAAIVLIGSGVAFAQLRAAELAPGKSDEMTDDALIGWLSSDLFGKREDATNRLRERAWKIMPLLRERLAKSEDMEQKDRLRFILANPIAHPYPVPESPAAVKGSVVFKGTPPKRKEIDLSGRPAEIHKDNPLLEPNIIVSETGKMANVLVYVSKGLEPYKFDPPEKPVTMELKGFEFQPHVIAVMEDQPCEIRNGDDTINNVHGLAGENPEFNESMQKRAKMAKKFKKPEVAMRFVSNIYPWMSAYCAVFSHPFFAVSSADGSFELKGLIPGKYKITAWHEVFGEQTIEVDLAAKEAKDLTFSFEKKK